MCLSILSLDIEIPTLEIPPSGVVALGGLMPEFAKPSPKEFTI